MSHTIYLVEDVADTPGRIYACFADDGDAEAFIIASGLKDRAEVVARTLFYGQPPCQGYNK